MPRERVQQRQKHSKWGFGTTHVLEELEDKYGVMQAADEAAV